MHNHLKRNVLARAVTTLLLSHLMPLPLSAATDYVSRVAKENAGSVVTIVAMDGLGTVYSQGTGFLASPDGVVVTCYHVIKDATLLAIKLMDGDLYDEVGIIETDPRRDIAVLRIKAANMRSLRIGDSNKVAVGEPVVAITSPQGLEQSVTDGCVSGIRDSGLGYKLFQISVPISQGSSGGPIFNSDGEVIGIASSQLVDGQNLNFAVPVNYVTPLMKNSPQRWLKRAASVAAPSSNSSPSLTAPSSPPVAPPSTFAQVLRLPGQLSAVEANGLIKVHDSYGYTTPIIVTQGTIITRGEVALTFKELAVGMRVEVEYGSESSTRQRYALKIQVL